VLFFGQAKGNYQILSPHCNIFCVTCGWTKVCVPTISITFCTKTIASYPHSLLHIVPFCERPNQKSEGFAKEKQKT
jgi:hypothetical protein